MPFYDPGYLGIERTDGIVFVQRIPERRSIDGAKEGVLRAGCQSSHEARVAPGDETIVLVENTREDWSFGCGVAQYLELPPEHSKGISGYFLPLLAGAGNSD
jgi:4-oxalocrotonate tautomerase